MSDDAQNDDGITLSAEIMDRAERKALREKAKKEEQAKKAERTPEEIEAALAQSKLAAAEKAKKKKIFKYALIVAVLAFFGWAGYFLFKPYKAGMAYGICKIFLELNVQFPQDLRISSVDDMGMAVRIWYTRLDAFGEYRMENMHCYFKQDEVAGTILDRVTVDRREVAPERIEAFNPTIPMIVANPPDLIVPYPLDDSLAGLHFNTDAFRFQLNLEQ